MMPSPPLPVALEVTFLGWSSSALPLLLGGWARYRPRTRSSSPAAAWPAPRPPKRFAHRGLTAGWCWPHRETSGPTSGRRCPRSTYRARPGHDLRALLGLVPRQPRRRHRTVALPGGPSAAGAADRGGYNRGGWPVHQRPVGEHPAPAATGGRARRRQAGLVRAAQVTASSLTAPLPIRTVPAPLASGPSHVVCAVRTAIAMKSSCCVPDRFRSDVPGRPGPASVTGAEWAVAPVQSAARRWVTCIRHRLGPSSTTVNW